MNNRSLIILSSFFVVVLLASVLVYVWPTASRNGANDPLHLRTISAAMVQKIAVSTPAATQTAERQNGAWQVDGEPVNAAKIDALLSGLPTASEDLVSRKGRETDAYGLAAEKKKTIVFTVGGKDMSYDVGATDYRTQGVYVAQTGADDAYLVHGTGLATFVSEDFASWKQATSTAATSTPVISTSTPKTP